MDVLVCLACLFGDIVLGFFTINASGVIPMEEDGNKFVLEQISFHLKEAMRLSRQLDLSRLGALEEKEWNERMKVCKDAIEFTKNSVGKLALLLV